MPDARVAETSRSKLLNLEDKAMMHIEEEGRIDFERLMCLLPCCAQDTS